MHILLIHQAYIGLDEAGGTRHAEMASYLADRGHRITIITGSTSYLTGKTRHAKPGWKEVEEPAAGITVMRVWNSAALHRGFLSRLVSFFSFMLSSWIAAQGVKNVDVVWGTSPPIFQAFSAWLVAFLKRKPFLFEVRDLWPAFAVAMGVIRSRFIISLSLWLERFLYRNAHLLVVNSPGFIEHVQKKGAENIALVPNGVDVSMFDPALDGADWRKRHDLVGKFLVVYAGAHGPSNDLGVVLQAAEILREEKDIHFVLIGDGKDKSLLQQQARKQDLINITFLPPVKKNEMKYCLAAADACLAILKPLTLYRTTYPNKVFDYMAAGRAVVLAIDGVIRSVVEEAQAGIFVPPGDGKALAEGINKLSHTPGLAEAMGQSGRRFVAENFDRHRFTQQFLEIVESLVRSER